jgi:hypothetical protein
MTSGISTENKSLIHFNLASGEIKLAACWRVRRSHRKDWKKHLHLAAHANTPLRFAFPPEVHRVKCCYLEENIHQSFAFPPEVHRVK